MAKEPEAGEMSFLEHLDELRRRLINSAIAITLAFAVGWAISDRLYAILSVPVTEALRASRAAQAVKGAENDISSDLRQVEAGTEVVYTFRAPVSFGGVEIPSGTTIKVAVRDDEAGQRFLEFKDPLAIGDRMFTAGTAIPLTTAAGAGYVGPDDRLVQETVQGAFNLYVKVAFYFAIALAVPFLVYQIWAFVAPGLYPHERKYVWPFVIATSICFAGGVYFAYEVAFPAACAYLIGVGSAEFRPLINADEYFDLILFIMLGLGLVFQIPTATFLLARLGLVTASTLIKYWRYAFMVILLLAAFLSPTADIPNMMVFAAPMVGLYVISIGVAWMFQRKRLTEEEALGIEGSR